MDADDWVPLAEVARPHGVKGELRLRLFNATSDVLLGQDEVLVRMKGGEEHEVSVERARRADDAILMKLFSVDDRNRAEDLRGAHICVRRRDFPEAEDGEFYAIDVVGSEARLAGERIGVVAELITYPSIEVLLIHADDGKGDWEVPLTEMFIGKVDVAGKVVELVTLDDVERTPRRKEKPKEAPNAAPNDAPDDAPNDAKDEGES
ncbi:MAG: rRNA processing protein RimM [Myxococcaceae bacterium]|jgi:16S rRNA processing protein RimM|nr:rRNA processing protein RimM [Myxococcaceae bacterium]MEA2749608.1 rRNA processing protein RimM [Myxococcales bacterium]